MVRLNRHLLRTLGLGWLAFALAGLVISQVFAVPVLVVLVDRSYCPAGEWQKLVQNYEQLYTQHRQKQLQIEKVILFSDLAEETLPGLSTPQELRNLPTYGLPNAQRRGQLQQAYPKSRLLTCAT